VTVLTASLYFVTVITASLYFVTVRTASLYFVTVMTASLYIVTVRRASQCQQQRSLRSADVRNAVPHEYSASSACVVCRSGRSGGPHSGTGAPAHCRARCFRRRGGATLPDAQGERVLAAVPTDAREGSQCLVRHCPEVSIAPSPSMS
jgi:hypothetical protein